MLAKVFRGRICGIDEMGGGGCGSKTQVMAVIVLPWAGQQGLHKMIRIFPRAGVLSVMNLILVYSSMDGNWCSLRAWYSSI
jgi:hypothetical protein